MQVPCEGRFVQQCTAGRQAQEPGRGCAYTQAVAVLKHALHCPLRRHESQRFMPPIPSVTKAFMLACVGLYCLFYLAPPGLRLWFELWPLQSGNFMPWQPITYAFLHGGELHLFFNMLGLWMFGSELERVWGAKRYTQTQYSALI
eukprot:Opistho-1_new@70944